MRIICLFVLCCLACLAFSQSNCPETMRNAIESGDLVAVALLLEKGCRADDVYEKPAGYQFTALSIAVNENELPIVRLLLDSGANPNKEFHGMGWPIFQATHPGREEVLKLLLERGANPNLLHSGSNSIYPIVLAIEQPNLEAVKLLLKAGAKVNFAQVTSDVAPPLAIALGHGNKEIIRILIDSGASVKQKFSFESEDCLPCPYDLSPLHIAGHVKGDSTFEIPKLLLLFGADVNAESDEAGTPLEYVAYGSNLRYMDFLIEHGARLYDEKRAAIECAATYSHYKTVEFLAQKGITKEWATRALYNSMSCCGDGFGDGITKEERIETAKILLAAGADLKMKFPEHTGSSNLITLLNPFWVGRIYLAEVFVESGKAKWEDIKLNVEMYQPKPATVTAPNGLRFRTHPSPKAPVIGTIPMNTSIEVSRGDFGEELEVDGRRAHWKYARWNGQAGFVFGGYLQ